MNTLMVGMLWLGLVVAEGVQPVQSVEERWQERLEALTPSDPMAYFLLAEEVHDQDPTDPQAARLAARLFGTAGRLDPDGLASSSALAIAEIMANDNEARRMRAVARMLDARQVGGRMSVRSGEVDSETAFEIGEALARLRSGRSSSMRKLLGDAAIMSALRPWDRALPGGLDWLKSVAQRRSGRPDFSRDELVQLLRMEVRLMEGEQPSWSSEVLGIHGRPLLEVQPDEIDDLLGGDPDRPWWRDGQWRSSPSP